MYLLHVGEAVEFIEFIENWCRVDVFVGQDLKGVIDGRVQREGGQHVSPC